MATIVFRDTVYDRNSFTRYSILNKRLDNLRSLLRTKFGKSHVVDFRYRPGTDEVLLHVVQDNQKVTWTNRVPARILHDRNKLIQEVSRSIPA